MISFFRLQLQEKMQELNSAPFNVRRFNDFGSPLRHLRSSLWDASCRAEQSSCFFSDGSQSAIYDLHFLQEAPGMLAAATNETISVFDTVLMREAALQRSYDRRQHDEEASVPQSPDNCNSSGGPEVHFRTPGHVLSTSPTGVAASDAAPELAVSLFVNDGVGDMRLQTYDLEVVDELDPRPTVTTPLHLASAAAGPKRAQGSMGVAGKIVQLRAISRGVLCAVTSAHEILLWDTRASTRAGITLSGRADRNFSENLDINRAVSRAFVRHARQAPATAATAMDVLSATELAIGDARGTLRLWDTRSSSVCSEFRLQPEIARLTVDAGGAKADTSAHRISSIKRASYLPGHIWTLSLSGFFGEIDLASGTMIRGSIETRNQEKRQRETDEINALMKSTVLAAPLPVQLAVTKSAVACPRPVQGTVRVFQSAPDDIAADTRHRASHLTLSRTIRFEIPVT